MDMLHKARNVAAVLIGGKMYTCREMYERLCRKGFEKELAEQVVSEFIDAGYLDDRKFAELYISDAVTLGAKGMYRIRKELMLKGISASVIDAAAETVEADTESNLKEFINQRNLCGQLHSRKDLEKLKARLVRRGYSIYEINECLSDFKFDFEDTEW